MSLNEQRELDMASQRKTAKFLPKIPPQGSSLLSYAALGALITLASIPVIYATGNSIKSNFCGSANDMRTASHKETIDCGHIAASEEVEEPFAPLPGSIAFADQTISPDAYSWTEVEYTALNAGTSDPTITFNLYQLGSSDFPRRACYKTSSESEPVCSSDQTNSSSPASIVVPTNAEQIGYEIYLPIVSKDPWSSAARVDLVEDSGAILRKDISLARDPSPYDILYVDKNYPAGATGWQETVYTTIPPEFTGTKTVSLYASISYTQVCYKVGENGSEQCGSATSSMSQTATASVPPEATHVGWKVYIGGTATALWQKTLAFTISSDGGTAPDISPEIDIERPAS